MSSFSIFASQQFLTGYELLEHVARINRRFHRVVRLRWRWMEELVEARYGDPVAPPLRLSRRVSPHAYSNQQTRKVLAGRQELHRLRRLAGLVSCVVWSDLMLVLVHV